MRTYTCLITDDRYAVPSLVFHEAQDDAAMRALALSGLRANPHWHDFEARLNDEPVFTIARSDADARS